MNNKFFLIVLLTVFLGACSSTAKKQEAAAVEDRGTELSTAGHAGENAQTYGAGTEATAGMNALDDPHSLLSVRIIYFEYDKSDIQPQFNDAIEAHGRYLAANPNVRVSLEGHADERGSREYNLALGERRAISVKRQMLLFGASASQIRTISYGEERPVADGHDEASWSQNRRVELIY
ncbi:MAG: peptidoglycan-associated lipoprotein Pal [Gammaproteobacteria bacterium]